MNQRLSALVGLMLATAAMVPAQAPASASDERALIDRTCVPCHNQRLKTGGLQLDQLDPAQVRANPEVWERVVRKLRAGMMPPAGIHRPAPDVYEGMIAWLERELDATELPSFPSPGLHRLNRTEYANAIRDLLDIEIDPAKFLPSDDSTRGFDNIAGALSLSPALLEGYTSAGGKISRIAVGDVMEAAQATYRVPSDTSQEYHIEGLPFGTRGGLAVRHEFPADGDYIFKIFPINQGLMDNNRAFGEITGERLELLIDGERVHLYDWDKDLARGSAVHNGTADVHFQAKAGQHLVGVTFLATQLAPGNDLNQHFLRSSIETGGLPGFKFFPHVGKVEIIGPFKPAGAPDSPSRKKIFTCRPGDSTSEFSCAQEIINTLARHAFRRPVTPLDTEALMSFYQQERQRSNFEGGIERALQRILSDPEFVFRKEAEPPDVPPGKPYRISDIELASRLSFFLWSSIPDEELIQLAAANRLHEPDVLERQVRRMLSDPRSEQFVVNFAGQWLNLRALQSWTPTTALFPDFDDNLRLAMRKETELFVESIVHEDRSVLDLLNADYTYVNERLAKHYGIPNVYGSNFRRVDLGPQFDFRRGLLGQASLQTISSQPQRTSPVGRGKMIMQIFLGVSPPDPPPNVPALKDQDLAVHGGMKPTMRQQMEAHRKVEPCASCHKIMDPIGFSMENFDAIGHWRNTDDGSQIDASGVLVDGTKLNGVTDLRQAILGYSPQFVRVLVEKLLIYALGRGTEHYDMPLVRSIVREAGKSNYRFSTLMQGIVSSDTFQMNRKSETNLAENGRRP